MDIPLTVVRHSGTSYEVYLSAYSGYLLDTDTVGNDLTHEVHLYAGVDAYQVLQLGNYLRMVYVVYRPQLNYRVLVAEVIQLLCSHKECNDHLSFVDAPFSVQSIAPFFATDLRRRLRSTLRVEIPRCFLSPSCASTASGIAPIPSMQRSAVIDEGMRSSFAIASSTSVILAGALSRADVNVQRTHLFHSRERNVSPNTVGT